MRLRRLAAGFVAIVLACTAFVSPALADGGATPAAPDVTKVQQILQLLQQTYKDPVDLNKAIDGAIKGAVQSLGDPFTDYFTAAEYQAFMSSLNGQVVGIGAFVDKAGSYIQITKPIEGSPAEAAGLRAGDIVLEVDGVSLKDMALDLAVTHIRGPEGSTTHLKIQRDKQVFTVDVVRKLVQLKMVHTKMLDGGVGYLQLDQFSEDSPKLVADAVATLKKQGAKGLVFDLRNNPGGYLNAAWTIGSMFVPQGQPVVRVDQPGQLEMLYNSSGALTGLPVAVLVNENTASAAEIVSGAIQDYKVGPLVGVKTYGKGTVQQIYGLKDGSGIKITVAEYLTGGGHHVHKIGITPDFVVQPYQIDPQREQDLTLTRGLFQFSVGLDVLLLQEHLDDLGYKVKAEDGFYSVFTKNAVEDFQKDFGLPVTGYVDTTTVQTINQAMHQTAMQRHNNLPDPQLDKALQLVQLQIKGGN